MSTEMEAAQAEKQPLQIDVNVEETSACERHVVVKIPQAEIARYRSDAFDEISPKAELPGFRAGKAPRRLVESRFREQVDEQVKSSLVMDSLQQITDGDYFSAISEPNFDYNALELPPEGDFRYEFMIEVRPSFETPEWQGLSLERPVHELTDADIDNHLSRTLRRFSGAESVEGACKQGDTLLVDMTFAVDGKDVGAVSDEEVTVYKRLLFGDAIVENFAEAVVGKSEGESFTCNAKLSDSAANKELAGKEVVIQGQINEVRRVLIEDMDAKTLAGLGFDSVEELREFVRSELLRQFDYHQQQALRKQAVAALLKDANWEMPESLVRRQTSRELQRMRLELERSGLPPESIKRILNNARLDAQQTTIQALREHFVLEKIAEDLEIEPTPQDYDNEVAAIAEQTDSSPRSVRARLEKTGQMDAVRNQIIEREVVLRITQAAQLKDVPDSSFLKPEPEEAHINHAIAGEFYEIPEAKHDNEPAQMPGSLKLPEKEKQE
jgi:trigger factor